MTTSAADPPAAASPVRVVAFVPRPIADQLRDAAERHHRSVAGQVRHALARYLEQDDRAA
jgi:hypothetical protein